MQCDKKRLAGICVSVHFHPPLHHNPRPKRKTLLPFFSSHSPPNPSLLHCICFLIQSVWEAHEPQEPPDQPPHHQPFCHWLQCCNPPPFDFLSGTFCLFFFSLGSSSSSSMHVAAPDLCLSLLESLFYTRQLSVSQTFGNNLHGALTETRIIKHSKSLFTP